MSGQFSASNDPNATVTESRNQVLVPSAYTECWFLPVAVVISSDAERQVAARISVVLRW
jgi:hypothetical protein